MLSKTLTVINFGRIQLTFGVAILAPELVEIFDAILSGFIGLSKLRVNLCQDEIYSGLKCFWLYFHYIAKFGFIRLYFLLLRNILLHLQNYCGIKRLFIKSQ